MKKVKTNKKQAKRNRKINTRALLLVSLVLVLVLGGLVFALFRLANFKDSPKEKEDVKISEVDLTSLKELIHQTKSFDRRAYTEESFANLDVAVQEAEQLIANGTDNQQDVESAYLKIFKTIPTLVTVEPEE